ncbi:MAG: M15 family metallopeptidase [Actinomycetota bacterium]
MIRPRRASVLGLCVALAAVVVTAGVSALDGPIGTTGATVTDQAVRIAPPIPDDVVSVYNSGELLSSTKQAAFAAATDAGAQAAVRQAATIGLRSVTRDGATVQQAPAGFAFPMGTTVLEASTVRALMGNEVAGALDAERLVMSALTASLRGAQTGDVVTLVSASGGEVLFEIGAVVDDSITGGTELLVTPAAAARLGLERESSVVIWDIDDRAVLEGAFSDRGLVSTSIRIRRSWDLFDPDLTLGMARTKALLGEFAYRLNGDGSVSIDTAWTSANLPASRVLLNPDIPIRARCHNVMEPALRDALAEVAAAGLAGTINVFHANTAGGCYVPRFSRVANSSIGFLSRHTWGQAIDTNTLGSCLGCAPPDFVTNPGGCDTIRIFRKHGFAWGGNFLRPDGMHFEYVGERRDQFSYPSRYCPNEVPDDGVDQLVAGELPLEMTMRPSIFSDALLVDADGHPHEHGHEHGADGHGHEH